MLTQKWCIMSDFSTIMCYSISVLTNSGSSPARNHSKNGVFSLRYIWLQADVCLLCCQAAVFDTERGYSDSLSYLQVECSITSIKWCLLCFSVTERWARQRQMMSWFSVSISVIYLWPGSALRWKLERETLNTPLVTKSLQANLSLVQASVAHLKAVV